MRLADLMNLAGRRALVTGATGHIGRLMVITLAEMGADLVLVDRPGSTFRELVGEVASIRAVKVESVPCDLEDSREREKLVESVTSGQDGLDILVNNAAFVGTSQLEGWAVPLELQTTETWRRAIEVNLTACFDLCRGLAPALRRSAGASIINIGSIYGVVGPDRSLYDDTQMSNPAAYAASKGGLIQLTRWLATTLAPEIRANAISPGGVFRNQPDVFLERYKSRTPLGRMATEDDFAGAIAYLASDMSRYVTGHNLMVDGGWSIW